MLVFSEPQLKDCDWISKCVKESGYMGSDASFANIYLLKSKYNTKVSFYKDFLIRYYEGYGSRHGYTFPLGHGKADKALEAIRQDALENTRKLEFWFVTEEQKEVLDAVYGNILEYKKDDGDSDYIYGQQELATLSGRAYHKKKNHLSKFKRTYNNIWFSEIGAGNIEALLHLDDLALTGGILYVNDVPAAMTIASYINDDTVDIHFEKCIGEYAAAGGYAAINQMHAEALKNVMYINREEDINIPGLRKAKESYHPKIMLKKYSAAEK